MQSNFVLNYNKVDLSKVVYDELVESSDKQFITSKIWYQENEKSRPHTFFVQTQDLTVDEVKSGNIMATVDDSQLYAALDKKSFDAARSFNISKKYGLKNVKYKPMITELTYEKDKTIDALKLSTSDKTQYFVNKGKALKSFDEVKSMLKAGTSVKEILEIDSLVIDLKHGIIYTNVLLRQVMLSVIVPLKVELSEYSFLDSDDEDNKYSETKNEVKQTEQKVQVVEKKEEKEKDKKEEQKTKDKKEKKQRSPSPVSEPEDTPSDNDESENDSSEDESSDEPDVEDFLQAFKNR